MICPACNTGALSVRPHDYLGERFATCDTCGSTRAMTEETTMDRYWDLTEAARAALTRDDVARYVDVELMERGVLKPTPLALLDETPPEMSARAYYRPGGMYDSLDIAFESADDVRAFLAMRPVRVGRDWQLGDIEFAKPIESDIEIRAVQLATRETVDSRKAQLNESTSAKKENERRKKAYETEQTAVDNALNSLWTDWHECMSKADRMKRIAETFADYLRMAKGDNAVASKFLRKVFTEEELIAAEEWTGAKMIFDAEAA